MFGKVEPRTLVGVISDANKNPILLSYTCPYFVVYTRSYITIHVMHLLYDLSISMHVSCLRAGLFIYLSIYLYLVLWKCATPSCRLDSVFVLSLVESRLMQCVLLFLSSSVNRAFEPVGKMVVRLTISIVCSSRRDRDAEHNSFPVFS